MSKDRSAMNYTVRQVQMLQNLHRRNDSFQFEEEFHLGTEIKQKTHIEQLIDPNDAII